MLAREKESGRWISEERTNPKVVYAEEEHSQVQI